MLLSCSCTILFRRLNIAAELIMNMIIVTNFHKTMSGVLCIIHKTYYLFVLVLNLTKQTQYHGQNSGCFTQMGRSTGDLSWGLFTWVRYKNPYVLKLIKLSNQTMSYVIRGHQNVNMVTIIITKVCVSFQF